MADQDQTDVKAPNRVGQEPSAPKPPPPAVTETVDPADVVDERPKVKIKVNPDFEGENAVVSVANNPDLKLSDLPKEVDYAYAELLLTSPAIVAAD